ncbi:MAG: YgfZ/GcvT domain-containing protein [Nevskiales bacterium]
MDPNQTTGTELRVELAHYSLLRASGADARDFLQAQLTSDLRELTPQRSQLAAWCNAKGRAQVIFRVFERADGIYLRLPTDLVAFALPRLKMFVLRAKVQLEDLSANWAALGVCGETASTGLGELPRATNEAVERDGLTLIRVPGDPERHEIWGARPDIAALRGRLQQTDAQCGSIQDWRRLNLAAGLPEISPETREAFTPHMLNLDLLGAVSFKKGCYPGQEVVAKTQHRGLAKRRLYSAFCATATLPAPGARVLTANDQHAGDVVEAVLGPNKECQLSAVLMLEHARDADLHLPGSDSSLRIQTPHYSLE